VAAITLDLACAYLQGNLVAENPASTAGLDAACRPYTRDEMDGHTYHYTIEFPPGFTEFFLHQYVAKANSKPGGENSVLKKNNFIQTLWTAGFKEGSNSGDISFGAAEDAGPVTSFGKTLMNDVACRDCKVPWPANGTIISTAGPRKQLRLGWGERNKNTGWFPWWSGTIRIR
jgi:hypothetical protein